MPASGDESRSGSRHEGFGSRPGLQDRSSIGPVGTARDEENCPLTSSHILPTVPRFVV